MIRSLNALIAEDAVGDAPAAAAQLGVDWQAMSSTERFLESLSRDSPGAVLVSLDLDPVNRSLVEKVIGAMGGSESVLLSAPGASLELALLARDLGVGRLLREPLTGPELKEELRRMEPVVDGLPLPDPPPTETGFHLVGSGEAMAGVVRTIAEVSGASAPVLLTGESGTGKELVARAIHGSSPRREGPFVAINCAAIPEQLLESEFFGHEKGAFTGAVARKRGRFERADGGTLFLDEVGDMSPILQAKLLRALEEGEIERVGAEASISVDVRVLAATNQELEDRVQSGSFREDLYFRLAGARIHLPPLRERMEDLEELVLHFAARFADQYGIRLKGVDRHALRLLRSHGWPGNVRELRNVVEGAVRTARGGWIRAGDLRLGGATPRLSAREDVPTEGYPPTRSLEEVEREHIARVLAYTGGAMGEAAEILGIHRNTLTRKADQYDLR